MNANLLHRRWLSLFSALALTTLPVACSTTSDDEGPPPKRFPYVFTPEPELPTSQTVRAEGATSLDLFANAVPYYQKYFEKKYTAPVEEYAHFDAQRELYAALERDGASAPANGVRLAMVGDLMWIRDQWDTFARDDLKRELSSYGALVGNLESPIMRSHPVPSDASDFLKYNSAPGLVRSFRGEGGRSLFSALSIANNHTFDQGDDGARETAQLLAEDGIPMSGVRTTASAPSFTTFTAGGIRFGYYATTWGFNDPEAIDKTALSPNALRGLAPEEPDATEMPAVDLAAVGDALAAMDREKVDVKIVSAHWGHEYELYPTPITMQLARRFVELGADVVVGAHPHVQQPNEICVVNGYDAGLPQALRGHAALDSCRISAPGRARKALVAYSLGNFATNMWGFMHELGLITSVEFFRDAGGAVDWRAPRHVFVHNARPPRAKERRLELLTTYLNGKCGGAGCSETTGAFADFAERHLTGVHLQPEEIARLRRLGAQEGRSLDDELLSFASSLGVESVLLPRMLAALEEDAR